MPAELIHIYGPFSIQSYGLMILIGVLVFMWRASRNILCKKYLTPDQFINLVTAGIIVGIIGGRLLHVVTDSAAYESWFDVLKVWEGGFSILGTVIAIVIWLPWYTRRHHIPIMPILDLAALYAPLLQSISRLGCFFAGCCYGTATSSCWGIAYSNPALPELYGKMLHPTQLYSSAALLIIFLILRFVIFPRTQGKGFIMCWYLIFIGIERCLVDFWRADRVGVGIVGPFSWYQLIALAISATGLVGFYVLMRRSKKI